MSTKFLKTILPSGAIRFAFPKEQQSRFATCVCGATEYTAFPSYRPVFPVGRVVSALAEIFPYIFHGRQPR